MTVTFIHAADVHLDHPFQGLSGLPESIGARVRRSTLSSWSRLVDFAVQHGADFIVIAGDVFDHVGRGLRAEAFFRRELERLHERGIDVFICHGNHDPLDSHWSGIQYGENARTFGPHPEVLRFEKPGRPTVHLYGFSYPTRHVTTNMLGGYTKASGADYHIGVLHGSIKGDADHDVYAPFAVADLLEKDFDYWALGHIHKRNVIHDDPPIVYPGSLQGLSAKETGEKGFYFVTMERGRVAKEFIPAGDVIWDEATIDLEGAPNPDALLRACLKEKEARRRSGAGVLLRVVLTGRSDLALDLMERADEYLEALRDGEDEREDFVWITALEDQTAPKYDRDKLAQGSHFLGDLIRLADERRPLADRLAPLYRHHQARRFLDPLGPEDEEAIWRAAEKWLLDSLLKNRDS